ncbi:unnamed protein product [Acanthosepion pharaonis]|uniref:Uncharacterized protein n=1 Tax=Acanthosepion pharaonis TaxID=158019 RepID=A0A812BRA0_ACAPH|nr:unnamed protein product [Sepia pharaonis]
MVGAHHARFQLRLLAWEILFSDDQKHFSHHLVGSASRLVFDFSLSSHHLNHLLFNVRTQCPRGGYFFAPLTIQSTKYCPFIGHCHIAFDFPCVSLDAVFFFFLFSLSSFYCPFSNLLSFFSSYFFFVFSSFLFFSFLFKDRLFAPSFLFLLFLTLVRFFSLFLFSPIYSKYFFRDFFSFSFFYLYFFFFFNISFFFKLFCFLYFLFLSISFFWSSPPFLHFSFYCRSFPLHFFLFFSFFLFSFLYHYI